MSRSALLVIAILIVVALFAMIYRPPGYDGEWETISRQFATDNRPVRFSYSNEKLFFSPIMPWWFAWSRIFSGEYCSFDVEMDQRGIWLRYHGPEPRKCAEFLHIPWSEIVGAGRVGELFRI